MPRSATRSVLVTGTAALALLATACSSSGDGGTANSTSTASTSASGAPAAYQSAHKGGTLHLVAKSAAGSLDPQVNHTLQYWQLCQGMYDGLLAFKKVGGQASFTVVPDLADGEVPRLLRAHLRRDRDPDDPLNDQELRDKFDELVPPFLGRPGSRRSRARCGTCPLSRG